MEIIDPQSVLNTLDQARLKKYLGFNPFIEDVSLPTGAIEYIEPGGQGCDPSGASVVNHKESLSLDEGKTDPVEGDAFNRRIVGKVLRLGDFIDTDAVSPPFLTFRSRTSAA